MQTQLRLCGCRLDSSCAGKHLRLSLGRLHYKPATLLPWGLGFWAVLGVTGDTLACQPGNIQLHLADSTTKSLFLFFFKATCVLKPVPEKPQHSSSSPGATGRGEQETHLAPAQLQHWAAPICLDTDMCTHTPAKYKINLVFKELQCQC